MKLEKATLGGFELPSKGWHAFEVTDRVALTEDGSGAATSTLGVFCNVIESEEEGRSAAMFCDLSQPGGRTALARLLYFLKMTDGIEKETGAGGDLSEAEWGDKFLDITKPKCEKLINGVIMKIPGKVFKGRIDHRPGKGKDRDGNTVERTYANFVELDFFGGDGKKAGAKKSESKAETAKEDSDEW